MRRQVNASPTPRQAKVLTTIPLVEIPDLSFLPTPELKNIEALGQKASDTLQARGAKLQDAE